MSTYRDLKNLLPGKTLDWEALLEAIPTLRALEDTPQDPVYHAEGNVLIHTRMVCEAMLELDRYQGADVDRRFVLFYAALLHDIAKPDCTREDNGRIISPGHSSRGCVDARILLWQAGVPFSLREQICQIIGSHQVPFFAIKGNRRGETPEFIVRRLSWELMYNEDLTAVAEADMRGRYCADAQNILDDIELYRELAREEACGEAPRAFADAHTRLEYCRGGGKIALDYPLYQEKGSKVLVMSGLPASGKNTWVAKNAKGLPVISFDDAREELGLKHGDNAGAAVQLAAMRARELLRAKAPFVWNSTHLSAQMRDKTLNLLFAYGAEVELVYVEAPYHEVLRRNSKRDTTLTNAGIEKMLFRWQVPQPYEAHAVRYIVN